jgi:adenine-specific DNA-methyltransferase
MIDVSILMSARGLARRMQPRGPRTGAARASLCLSLLNENCGVPALAEFKSKIGKLPIAERHYWIGTLYTLLLSPTLRREQAAYFTPPHLADAIIDLAIDAGFDPTNHKVLDPAAGGAAFLSTIVGRRLDLGLSRAGAIKGLHGFEIDPGLAQISIGLIADRVRYSFSRQIVKVCDALTADYQPDYDLVIANPPYGRIKPGDVDEKYWGNVAHRGHVNKYALFAELSLRAAKPGGLVALVIPSSFRAGPLYDRLRAHIRKEGAVLALGTVAGREGMFADVAQDISVVLLRKGMPHRVANCVRFPTLPPVDTDVVHRAKLPADPRLPWPTPSDNDGHVGGARLADYGVDIRAGYFVWNRERDRLVATPRGNSYPLIWAKNVKAGRLCIPAGKKGDKVDFVTFSQESVAIIRTHAAVLQRTTNDKQPRRLVAALVDPKVVRTWGGFVSENHTIVLTSRTKAWLKLVVALLNTKAVDDRYRRVSGTAAISVCLLRTLDIPPPARFSAALELTGGDPEAAATIAYTRNVLGGQSQ